MFNWMLYRYDLPVSSDITSQDSYISNTNGNQGLGFVIGALIFIAILISIVIIINIHKNKK